MRRYGNGMATDEVFEVAIVRDDWNDSLLNQLDDEIRVCIPLRTRHICDKM